MSGRHRPGARARSGGKPLRIAFWGNFGTGNWGNECTLQAIIHNARERIPEAELSCFCFQPEDTLRRHGLPSFPITDLRMRGPAPVAVAAGTALAAGGLGAAGASVAALAPGGGAN